MSSKGIQELEEDLEALDGSIEHWVRMRDGTHRDRESPGAEDCACCRLSLQRAKDDDRAEKDYCEHCPIYDVTGIVMCLGTPYKGAYSILRGDDRDLSPEEQSYCVLVNGKIERVHDLARLSTAGRFESPVAKEIKFLKFVRARVASRLAKLKERGSANQ